ncbi:DUF4430 domain-containing protein [Collinsella tanakaei]|uniref:DUF4430 domain-containing protein n=1 Tax=Collinsella tanakaei TaxID=626935 RepID=UPI0025A337C0|nr:DUF4430 domain-containing protein [Collinsella tanakaei]MDM8299852.1 DUF4430 domain-containing protein [Collinsella tanakaei]
MDDRKIKQADDVRVADDAAKDAQGSQSHPDDFLRVASEGSPSGRARAGASRRPIVLGALAVLCAALIVVSLGFIHPGPHGSWSVSWLFQTTAEASSNDAEQGSAQQKPEVKDEKNENEPEEAKDEESSADDATDTTADSAGASDGQASGSVEGAGGSVSYSDAAGSDESEQSGATQTAPEQSAPAPQEPPAEQRHTVTVSVSVSSSAVGGQVSGGGTFTFDEGATAYDALCACGLSVNASNSALGIYVSAIGGLAEMEYGEASGWNYAVNGVTPGMSSGSYVLSDGDSVEWFYITG